MPATPCTGSPTTTSGPITTARRARSYVDAIVLGADNATGIRAVGYYDDELVRTEHGWQIRRRRFTSVLLQPVGPGVVSPEPEAS